MGLENYDAAITKKKPWWRRGDWVAKVALLVAIAGLLVALGGLVDTHFTGKASDETANRAVATAEHAERQAEDNFAYTRAMQNQSIFALSCVPSDETAAPYYILGGANTGARQVNPPWYTGPMIDFMGPFPRETKQRCQLENAGQTSVKDVKLTFHAAYFDDPKNPSKELLGVGASSVGPLLISALAPIAPVTIEIINVGDTEVMLSKPVLAFTGSDGVKRSYSFAESDPNFSMDLSAPPPPKK